MNQFEVKACVDGEAIELYQVSDSIFAQKLAGDGIAIVPRSNKFVSPVAGTIRMLFAGLHAFVVENAAGYFILVHIGTNTLQLNGQGFEAHIQQGDTVEVGDLIITADNDMMKDPKIDYTTVVLVMNHKERKMIEKKTSGSCQAGESTILRVMY